MSDWINTRIRDMFASSTPGDWGTEGSADDGIPVLRSTNFRNDGTIDYSDIAYRKVEEARLSKRRVTNETILIEKSGGSPTQAAGRVVYCDRDFNGTASNFIEVVKVRNNYLPLYVAYLLYYQYQVGLINKYQQQTTGIINFKLNEYSEEILACPASKFEQTKIAEILSAVDRAIERTGAVIAKQQRIKTGLMQGLLARGIDEQGALRSEYTHTFKDSPLGRIPSEWDSSRLESIGNWASGGTPSKANSSYWGDEIPWLCPRDMKTFDINSTIDRLTQAGVRHGSRLMPEKTVFIVVRGMILAHTFPVCIADRPMAFNQDVKAIVTEPNVEPRFLAYWLVSQADNFLKLTTTSTHGTRRFDMNELFDVVMPIPEKEEQTRVVTRLDAAEEQIDSNRKIVRKLRSLKTGLMQDLLTGRRRVTALLEPEPKHEKIYARH